MVTPVWPIQVLNKLKETNQIIHLVVLACSLWKMKMDLRNLDIPICAKIEILKVHHLVSILEKRHR